MKLEINSLRTFIGSKDFATSRSFYQALGFEEVMLDHDLCLFRFNNFAFYLQNAYVEDWLNNTMLFVEVPNVVETFAYLKQLNLEQKYPGVKLHPIKQDTWGDECFLIDPAGALLHFGQFHKQI